MGKLTYVRKGTSRMSAFKAQQRIEKKEKKKGTFLRPAKVYGRKVRISRRRVRRIVNPSGVSVFKRIAPARRKRMREMRDNGTQSSTDWVFG